MEFDVTVGIKRLEATAIAIDNLVKGLSPEEARWKPAADTWAAIEIINHLIFEEVEDFRPRLDIILHRPANPFAPIDPAGTVGALHFIDRDLTESLGEFAREREASIRWLHALGSSNWESTKDHPAAGTLGARQFLACWVAHDLLHLRQLTKLRYDSLVAELAPQSLEYAGNWR